MNSDCMNNVKHVSASLVKTITIRDLRQRWPKAEAALQVEDKIIKAYE